MEKAVTRILFFSLALAACGVSSARGQKAVTHAASWREQLNHMLPLVGHRNWILIVDSAYPLQVSPGVETIETGEGLPEVTNYVLNAVGHSIHVRPDVYQDAELSYVREADAPGVSEFRKQIRAVLGDRKVSYLLHEQLLQRISEAGTSYKILVLKTNAAIPYTSVFLRLDCRYWSDDAEVRLRQAMKQAPESSQ
jgi:RbsD / FucU transport protein family